MLRRILVPLDGSPSAEQAIPFAAHLARQSAGTVLLLRVLREPTPSALPSMTDSMTRASWTFLSQTWADIAATYVAHAATHPALAGVEVETGIATGDEAHAILTIARSREADAIVLCGQAVASATDWGLSDVAQRVIRGAEVPVLAVPEYGAELEHLDSGYTGRSGDSGRVGANTGWWRPLRAVVALDGSPHAEAVLDLALPVVSGLAAPQPGALHLVHVAADGETAEDGKAYLSAVAHDLRTGPFADQLLAPTWSVVRDRDVVRAVLAQAFPRRYRSDDIGDDIAETSWLEEGDVALGAGAEWGDESGDDFGGEMDAAAFPGADLIVMATHGRRGPAGWDAERIVADVLRLATVPVLLVRPPLDDAPALAPGESFADDRYDTRLAGAESMTAEGAWW